MQIILMLNLGLIGLIKDSKSNNYIQYIHFQLFNINGLKADRLRILYSINLEIKFEMKRYSEYLNQKELAK